MTYGCPKLGDDGGRELCKRRPARPSSDTVSGAADPSNHPKLQGRPTKIDRATRRKAQSNPTVSERSMRKMKVHGPRAQHLLQPDSMNDLIMARKQQAKCVTVCRHPIRPLPFSCPLVSPMSCFLDAARSCTSFRSTLIPRKKYSRNSLENSASLVLKPISVLLVNNNSTTPCG